MTASQPHSATTGEQTAGQPAAAGMLSATDLAVFSSLPLLLGLSWGLPKRAWPRFCAAVAPFAVRMHVGDPAAMAARYAGRLTPYVLKCPGKWSGWFHL